MLVLMDVFVGISGWMCDIGEILPMRVSSNLFPFTICGLDMSPTSRRFSFMRISFLLSPVLQNLKKSSLSLTPNSLQIES